MSNGKEHAKVTVANGRYRFEGRFHQLEANTPIWDEAGKLVGVTNPRDMTYVHTYGGEAVFFESLSKGRLLASRCDQAECEAFRSVFLPFRIHCPDCLMKNTPVDITDLARTTATVHTFMVTERTGAFNTLPKPVRFVNIDFSGVATILMGYLAVGEPRIGLRVVPIFKTQRPSYTILDLSWVPEGTRETDLPEGYRFR